MCFCFYIGKVCQIDAKQDLFSLEANQPRVGTFLFPSPQGITFPINETKESFHEICSVRPLSFYFISFHFIAAMEVVLKQFNRCSYVQSILQESISSLRFVP